METAVQSFAEISFFLNMPLHFPIYPIENSYFFKYGLKGVLLSYILINTPSILFLII